MLEKFFDDEKVFSVFKFLLESDNVYCTPADIGDALNIKPGNLIPIIINFQRLNIVEFYNPLIKLNISSPIVEAICVLDEFVESYVDKHNKGEKLSNSRRKMESFQAQLAQALDDDLSLQEFVATLK